MGKKCKCPPPGAPDWMVTYGDMVTLLLCFFVLIVSFSEIKKEDDFQAVVEEIKKAFGMKGGGGKLPTEEDPALSLIQILETTRLHTDNTPAKSQSIDEGVDGKHQTVKTVREGQMFVVGGPVIFEPGSADLSEQAKEDLIRLADQFKGENNLIKLRGHTAQGELQGDQGVTYRDLWDLSHARAKVVMDFLASEQVGIRPERLRLVAVADQEPMKHRAVTSKERRENRRVEVIVTESLVQDHQRPAQRSGH